LHEKKLLNGSSFANAKALHSDIPMQEIMAAESVVQLGITDPLIFEIIGLFEEDFGPDRLSDMAVSILWNRFLSYSYRILKELDLKPRATFVVAGKTYQLPVAPWGKRMILVPSELLDPLPIAPGPLRNR